MSYTDDLSGIEFTNDPSLKGEWYIQKVIDDEIYPNVGDTAIPTIYLIDPSSSSGDSSNQLNPIQSDVAN